MNISVKERCFAARGEIEVVRDYIYIFTSIPSIQLFLQLYIDYIYTAFIYVYIDYIYTAFIYRLHIYSFYISITYIQLYIRDYIYIFTSITYTQIYIHTYVCIMNI